MNIKFKDTELIPQFNKYGENMTTRIDFIDASDGIPYITLSTNLSIKLQDDEIYVKEEATHLEIAQELVKQEYLIPMPFTEKSGYCTYRRYQMTPKLLKEANHGSV